MINFNHIHNLLHITAQSNGNRYINEEIIVFSSAPESNGIEIHIRQMRFMRCIDIPTYPYQRQPTTFFNNLHQTRNTSSKYLVALTMNRRCVFVCVWPTLCVCVSVTLWEMRMKRITTATE